MFVSVRAKSALLSIILLALFLGGWQIAATPTAGTGPALDPEYAALLGVSAQQGKKTPMPTPIDVGARIAKHLEAPFADGLGQVRRVPERIDFDPYPWHSMAVWMLSQMKRWGQIRGDVNYAQIAEQVFLTADAGRAMRELGGAPPAATMRKHTIMGKEFDPANPEAYIASFAIRRT